MKKIVSVIIALCLCVCAYSQNEYSSKFARFYVPNSTGSPFPMPVDAYVTILDSGDIYIKIHANNPYNAAEFSDYQKYAILKGSNLYLKLVDEDILTLTCTQHKVVKDGYVTTKNGVYQKYADYSYFPIDTEIIEKLKNNDIIKVRGQFKFEIIDGSMQFTPDSEINTTKDTFIEAIQTIQTKYKTAKSNSQTQEILKENPLHGF